MLWRARNNKRHIQRWQERFGLVPKNITEKQCVWLHTVSVGEFLGALPLIQSLLKQTNIQLVITCTTLTGSERIKTSLGSQVLHYYIPYDLPGALTRFILRIKPTLLLVMETELWPNTLHLCHQHGIACILINARLSERSASGYRAVAPLARPMLAKLTAIAAQHDDDAKRFIRLGVQPDKILVTGNIKFDVNLPGALRTEACNLKQFWSLNEKRTLWIAASTHNGEETIVLDTLRSLRNAGITSRQLLLILVPRHPERFSVVETLCEKYQFKTLRRTMQLNPDENTDVLLADTMGELPLLFGLSDIVFMGGSLTDIGGHNFIEPAVWGLPLISGPHLHNFAEVSHLLTANNALEIATDETQLTQAVQTLFSDKTLQQKKGSAALAVANNNRGALDKTLELIRTFYNS